MLKHKIPLPCIIIIVLPVPLIFNILLTTCISDTVLAVANTSLLLVVYVLSDKLVTVPALVVVIMGDVEQCISENNYTQPVQ